jgi:hypothetical protein
VILGRIVNCGVGSSFIFDCLVSRLEIKSHLQLEGLLGIPGRERETSWTDRGGGSTTSRYPTTPPLTFPSSPGHRTDSISPDEVLNFTPGIFTPSTRLVEGICPEILSQPRRPFHSKWSYTLFLVFLSFFFFV